MLPEILLFGEAGSGKDSAAAFFVKNHGAVALAMADPMKRLAMAAFGFSEETLWGPSSARNAVDERFKVVEPNEHAGFPAMSYMSPAMHKAAHYLATIDARHWCADLLGVADLDTQKRLNDWFHNTLVPLSIQHGGLSARTVLQTLGTEWGRHVSDTLWIRYAQRAQRKLVAGGYTYDRTKGLVETPGQKYDLAVVTDGRFRNEALEFKAGGSTVIKIYDPNATSGLQAGVKGHASEAEQKTLPDFWFDHIILNNKEYGLSLLERKVRGLVSFWYERSGR